MKKRNKFLKDAELAQIRAGSTMLPNKDRLILELFLNTGLRVSELNSLIPEECS